MIGKVTFDIDEVDLNSLFEVLNKNKIDLCFVDDCLYIYSPQISSKYFCYLMRESKIKNYFLKEITKRPEHNPENYAETWVWEKFNQDEKEKLEREQQVKLKEMMDNIDKARVEFRKQLEKSKENVSRETKKDE